MKKNTNNSKVVAALNVKSGVQAGKFNFRQLKPVLKAVDGVLDAGSIASMFYDMSK